MGELIVEVKDLKNNLSGKWEHNGVNFHVRKRQIAAIIGGSGTGKTTILKSLLLLQKPTSGEVNLFGHNIWQCSDRERMLMRRRIGMMFQGGALFSALRVIDNIMFPMTKHTTLPKSFMKELALLKLSLVGLSAADANKYPSELSGGMQKRAAAARALALDPDLLLLDEPLSGLDPQSGKSFDELLLFLRDTLQLTIIMVSHHPRSIERIADQAILLADGKVADQGSVKKLKLNQHHPLLSTYFEEH